MRWDSYKLKIEELLEILRGWLCRNCKEKMLSVQYKNLLAECRAGKQKIIQDNEKLIEQIHLLEYSLGILKAPLPETSGTISISSLRKLLTPWAKNIWLSDSTYNLVLHDSMKSFLALDDTNRNKYVSQYYDCDDFSFRLIGQASTPEWAGIAFGFAWSKSHAFNIFISASRQIYLIEPQTDKIIKIEDAQGAYVDLQLVVI